MPDWEQELEVIGLRFRWKETARRALAGLIEQKGQVTGCRLVREPENEYDENAIAVYLPGRLMGGKQLGYLHRETAAVLAPKLDEGVVKIVNAELWSLSVDDKWNTGELRVRFRDVVKKRSTKPKSKSA